MSWTYAITPHTLTSPAAVSYSEGLYSGTFGPTQNNPAYIAEANKGPIPPGNWSAELVEDDAVTGEYTIVLKPADNATLEAVFLLGRAPYSFRMHGDDIANPGHGSEGCIVAPREVREAFWNSPDHGLKVIA